MTSLMMIIKINNFFWGGGRDKPSYVNDTNYSISAGNAYPTLLGSDEY